MVDALVVFNVKTETFYEKFTAMGTVTIVSIKSDVSPKRKKRLFETLFNHDDSPKKFVPDLEPNFIDHF